MLDLEENEELKDKINKMDVKYAYCDEQIVATKSVDDNKLKLVWNNFFALKKIPNFKNLRNKLN